jgi:hypothetical protein
MPATYTQEYLVSNVTPPPNNPLFGDSFVGSSGNLVQDVQAVDNEYGYVESEFAVTQFKLAYGSTVLGSLEVTLGSTDTEIYFEIDMSNINTFNAVWLLVTNAGGSQGFNCEVEEVSNSIAKCGLKATARYHAGEVKVNMISKIRKYVE